jgi:hypothetical protein
MKSLEELENIRNETKSLLDSCENELIDIVAKISSMKRKYQDHIKLYTYYQKNFIKADVELNKTKKNL